MIPSRILRCNVSELPVGIVGCGIGGSALALGLQRMNIPFIVFESDRSFGCRSQGYALTLQQGWKTLQEFDVQIFDDTNDAVHSHSHVSLNFDGKVVGVYGPPLSSKEHDLEAKLMENYWQQLEAGETLKKNIIPLLQPVGSGRKNVHIPRQLLRKKLLEKVDERSIKWNKKMLSFEQSEKEENVVLHFSDGASSRVSCLIGADGIYSNVRVLKLKSSHPLNYLGLIVILGIAPMPEQISLMFHRKIQWVNGRVRVFSMPYDSRHSFWQLSFPATLEDALASATSKDQLKQLALRACAEWHTPLVELIESTPSESVTGHPVYDRNPLTLDDLVAESNPNTSLVTLLGDACHPMSPFKGQGANQALLDAQDLCHALQSYYFKSKGSGHAPNRSLSSVIKDYERSMLLRSASKVHKSRSAAKFLHSSAALAPGNITRAAAAEIYHQTTYKICKN